MSITPKYVIVGDDDSIIRTEKNLSDAREAVKGTNNRIYNMETRSYETISDKLDKYSLKNEIITIADELDKMASHIMSPACADDETGILRARVYTAMSKLNDELKKLIYQIH